MQEIEKIDFWDVIKELAKMSNIDIEKYQLNTTKMAEYTDEKEKIKRIHKLAQQFFSEELQKNKDALLYLTQERKLDAKTIKNF
ncbi:hypothetical protein KKG31_05115 [Patescibacteria group bacterium]|nr:hypothetical protein [Patescibacteria group bacterium]MBU1758503.1 hypothetical protein [Patescibacteria group bacterium]